MALVVGSLALTLFVATVVSAADPPPDPAKRLADIADKVRGDGGPGAGRGGMRALSADDLAFLGVRPGTGACEGLYEMADASPGDACTHGFDPAHREFSADEVDLSEPAAPGLEAAASCVVTDTCPAPPGWTQPTRIPCYSTGPYVEVLYVYKGTPEGAGFLEKIRRNIAAVDLLTKISAASVKNSSGTPGNRHVRWAMTAGCHLKITSVKIADSLYGFSEIKSNLVNRGIITSSRKYIAFIGPGGCSGGLAELPQDTRAGASNASNRGGTLGVFDAGCVIDPVVVAHELMHTLGAVQGNAPHTTGGHCWDDRPEPGWGADVMCYDDGGSNSFYERCGPTRPETFDCGKDDYFNPYPKAGSYLERYWNSARNVFLSSAEPPAWDPLALPTVSLPASGGTIAGEAVLTATVTAPPGLSVQYIETTITGDGTNRVYGPPWTFEIDTFRYASLASIKVTAVAVDSLEGRGVPVTATYTVANPQVHLDSPLAHLPSSPKFAWAASASAFAGRSVTKVQLLVNGTPVVTDTTKPYGGSIDRSSLVSGPGDAAYTTLAVRVTDSGGTVRTSPDREVWLTSPGIVPLAPGGWTGAALGTTHRLRALVQPGVAVPISKVEFLVDDVAVGGADTSAPYSVAWVAAGVGTHDLTVRVTDSSGFVELSEPVPFTVVEAVASPASVALTAPADGATGEPVANGLTATASATAPSGGDVDAIEFYLDGAYMSSITGSSGSVPIDLSWIGTGPHQLSAVAYGSTSGGDAWSLVSADRLIVVDGPDVAITAPAANATVRQTATITATVGDLNGGPVYSVEFYQGARWLGSDESAPFSLAWDTLEEPDGQGRLTAVVSAESGTTRSAVRFVNKKNLYAWFNAPTPGATVSGPVTFKANGRCDIDCAFEVATFRVDGVPVNYDRAAPYQYTWDSTTVADGPHTYSVTFATNDARAVSTTTFPFTVDND